MHLRMLYAFKDEWICDFNINFLTAPKQLSNFTFFYSFSWRRKRQPAPVFLPEESHGQRGLVDCSLWGCKELDMTKQLTHTHTHTHTHTNNVGELIDAVILKTKTKKVKIIFMNKSLSINVKFTFKKKISADSLLIYQFLKIGKISLKKSSF